MLEVGQWSNSRSGRRVPMKVPRYPLKRRAGGLRSRSGCFGEEQNLLQPGIEGYVVQPVTWSVCWIIYSGCHFQTKRICKQNDGLWSGEDKSVGIVDAVDDSVVETAVGWRHGGNSARLHEEEKHGYHFGISSRPEGNLRKTWRSRRVAGPTRCVLLCGYRQYDTEFHRC
jgi:hypothetical protein